MKSFLKVGLLALICLLLATSVWCAEASIDLSQPLPRLRLSDGRILQKVVFVKFNAIDIFIRYTAGSMSLRYEALPDDIRAAAEQKRPGGPKWFPGETAEKNISLEGQVFVTTRGASTYKFGEVKVYAFDARHLDAWDRVGFDKVVHLPKALAVATTDGDGKFRISVPKDTPYFLFCQAHRMVGQETEYNEWRVPGEAFKNPKEAFLSGSNQSQLSKVVIEETE